MGLAPVYIVPIESPSLSVILDHQVSAGPIRCNFTAEPLNRIKRFCHIDKGRLIFEVGPVQRKTILAYWKAHPPADLFQIPPLEMEVYISGNLYGKTKIHFFLLNQRPVILGSYLVKAHKRPYCAVIAYDPQHLYLSAQIEDRHNPIQTYSIFSPNPHPLPFAIQNAQLPSSFDVFWMDTESSHCKTTVSNGMSLAIKTAEPLTEEAFIQQLVTIKKQKITFHKVF